MRLAAQQCGIFLRKNAANATKGMVVRMKPRILALALLLSIFCMLASCGKPDPLPTESDASAVSAEESTPEESNDEETQKLAADLLSAFLSGELSAEREGGLTKGVIEWIAFDRVQEIREQVKTIGKPFLTEADVLRIAAYTADFCAEEVRKEQAEIALPAFDTMSEHMEWVTSGGVIAGHGGYASYEARSTNYNVMLAYTLYLFTPPKYAFSAEEVQDPLSSVPYLPGNLQVYLALAGDYETWRDALTALREQRQGVILYVREFDPGVQTPEFHTCYDAASLLRDGGEGPALELCDMVSAEENPYLLPRAQEYVVSQLRPYTTVTSYNPGYYELDMTNPASSQMIYVLLSPETANQIRTLREYLTEPVLTQGDMQSMFLWIVRNFSLGATITVRLPGADGTEDVLLPPSPAEQPELQRQRVLAYLVDLFTPSAFRFSDLLSISGSYYELAEGGVYLLVTEDYQSCVIDRMGINSRLFWRNKTEELS